VKSDASKPAPHPDGRCADSVLDFHLHDNRTIQLYRRWARLPDGDVALVDLVVFEASRLDRIVGDIIPATVPAGHTNAIVGTLDGNGVKVGAVFTLGADQRWAFKGAYEHQWTGDNSEAGQVIFSW
jgi:hypothetical protein